MDIPSKTNQSCLLTLYTLRLIYGKHKSILFVCYLYVQHKVQRHTSFNVHALNKSVLKRLITNIDGNTVIISKDMLNILKMMYSWKCNYALLQINGSKSRARIVSVKTVPNLNLRSMIVSSETLPNQTNDWDSKNTVNLIPLTHAPEKVVDKAQVALVHHYLNIQTPDVINALLHSYFSQGKFLYVNDVFEVSPLDYAPELVYSANSTYSQCRYFFKCVNLQDKNGRKIKCGMCVKGKTELSQVANTQAFIPKENEVLPLNFACSKLLDDQIMPGCPESFRDTIEEMASAVRPFFTLKDLRLKPMFLLKGPSGSGKSVVLDGLIKSIGLSSIRLDATEISAATPTQTESKLRNLFLKLRFMAPCAVVLEKFEVLCPEKDGKCDQRMLECLKTEAINLLTPANYPIVLFCVSNSNKLDSSIERIFLQVFEIVQPNGAARVNALKWLCKKYRIDESRLNFDFLSRRTNNFLFGDLVFLIEQVRKEIYLSQIVDLDVEDEMPATMDGFNCIIDRMQKEQSSSLGAPDIARVLWSDVGGLEDVKQEIIKTINVPLKHESLFRDSNLKRSGLLLYGPPGTGKTLIAKAVATECGLNFVSVKGPELLNMYVGQSESNVREVFTRARQAAPCIIFFDELDSLAPNRGFSGDSGGVMDRLVSQLLAEMDGLDKSAFVFVIGATNRPDLIDAALLRPGRFDKLLYVGISNDLNYKMNVFRAQTRKLNLPDNVAREICELLPDNITGADIQGIISQAWLHAVRDYINSGRLESVSLSAENFRQVLDQFTPSISGDDLQYYNGLKMKLSDR